MNIITRRIAATTALLAAPALIALGAATGAHAETSVKDTGPAVNAPVTPGQHVGPTAKAQPWQPRTNQQRRHHGQRRHAHRNMWLG